MRKLAPALLVTLGLALSVPAVADAHTLSCDKAREVSHMHGTCYRFTDQHVKIENANVYQYHNFWGLHSWHVIY